MDSLGVVSEMERVREREKERVRESGASELRVHRALLPRSLKDTDMGSCQSRFLLMSASKFTLC